MLFFGLRRTKQRPCIRRFVPVRGALEEEKKATEVTPNIGTT